MESRTVLRLAATCVLLPFAGLAQAPRTHFLFPSPLYIPATGQFAGKGAFTIFINENPSAAQNCTTNAMVTPDPTGAVKVDPLNAAFSGGTFAFDVTVNTGQLTKFDLPVTWTTTCVTAASTAQRAAVTFSVKIDKVQGVIVGNGNGNAGNNPDATPGSDPISTATGELYGFDDNPDLALGGPLPLEFRRYYGSLLSSLGSAGGLGANWMHNFETRLARSGDRAIVKLFRGKTVEFTRAGGNWQVSSVEQRRYQLSGTETEYQFLDPTTNLVYAFNSAGGLIRISDRNGNTLTVTQSPAGPTQVDDGLGRTLRFSYGGGRLTRVEDQTGRGVTMAFAATGAALSSVTDANGKITRYAYATAGGLPTLMTAATLPAGNQPFTQEYDTRGRVSRQIDSRGNATRLDYGTTLPQTTSVTDPFGGATRHVYGLPGTVTEATDPGGQRSTTSYDSFRRRTERADRRGGRTVTSYHAASGLPASITDALGNVTTFTYAAQAQGGFTYYVLTRTDYADRTFEAFAYDARGNLTSYTDNAGKVWTRTYNNRGQVLTDRNPAAGETVLTYNADQTIASRTLPSGDRITYQYDTLKRLVRENLADGSSRSFTYDGRDRLLTSTDERGKRVSAVYNDNGQLQSVTDATNQTARFAYDGDERLSTATDPLGRASRNTYDEAGRVKTVSNAANESETYGYDALGRVTAVSDSGGKRLDVAYDPEGALTSRADGLGNTWRFARDAMGRVTRATDPLGNGSSIAYDSLGRPTSYTDPLGEATRFSYDARGLPAGATLPEEITATYTRNDLGLISGITDPNRNVWTTGYDSSGRRTSDTDPLGRVTSYAYDNRQRVRQVILPEGSATLTYDAAGNMTRRQYSDGIDLQFSYDDNNQLVSANDVTLGYDANGRITASNGLQIARDSVGRIASITYAAGKTVTYEYNAQGLLVRVRDWVGGVTEIGHDAARRIVSIRRPNGVASQLSYAADGRVSGAVWSGGSVNASIRLQRDAAGRVTGSERNLPRGVDFDAAVKETAYDTAHQARDATYDRMGRVVSSGGRTFTWNLDSRLQGIRDSAGASSFRYDALGQLITGRQTYVWNYALSLPSIAVAREGQADVRYYAHLPNGQLLHSIDAVGNQRRFYHFDETGTTVFLTNDAGAVTDTYGITPYGESISRSGSTDNPFTFLGAYGVMQIGDSLFYMRARFYDASAARFVSRDPLRLLDPRAINPYQYAFANPLRFVDPRGLSPEPQPAKDVRVVDPRSIPVRIRLNQERLIATRSTYNLTLRINERGIHVGSVFVEAPSTTGLLVAILAETFGGLDQILFLSEPFLSEPEEDDDKAAPRTNLPQPSLEQPPPPDSILQYLDNAVVMS